MNRNKVILGLATVTTGLSAGVFYTFSVAVNPAFARLSDANYIAAMQAINKDIQNPVFFSAFFGAAVLLPLAAYAYRRSDRRKFKLLAMASLLYVVGVVGVTGGANVPLNDTLAKVPVQTATSAELATARTDYVEPWNKWHAVRTIAGVATLTAVAGALLVSEKSQSKR